MYRILISSFLVVLLGSKTVSAQHAFDQFFAIAWDVNIPMGDKWVDETSFAGGTMEYRKMVNSNVSVGVDMSWNSYYSYSNYQTYKINGATDITTDLYKYNYTLPLAVTTHYYFNTSGGIFQPYAGLGLGAMYASPRLYFNIYEVYHDEWGFLVRPEVGTLVKFDKNDEMGLLLGVRYSYSTNEEKSFKIDNMQALGFNLGLVFLY